MTSGAKASSGKPDARETMIPEDRVPEHAAMPQAQNLNT
jgi:hypothetical protein